jgi:hypothetical protein
MFVALIKHAIEFLAANPVLVGMVIAAEEFVKKLLEGKEWFNGWVKIALAFVLAIFFVLPENPAFSWELVAEVIAVGGSAAGLFSAGASLAAKARE